VSVYERRAAGAIATFDTGRSSVAIAPTIACPKASSIGAPTFAGTWKSAYTGMWSLAAASASAISCGMASFGGSSIGLLKRSASFP